MDTPAVVKHKIESTVTFLEQFPFDRFEVDNAFWMKDENDGRWQFYLVSALADKDDSSPAHRKLYEAIAGMNDPALADHIGIRLIGTKDPIAVDAAYVASRLPRSAKWPIPWCNGRLGQIPVEEAYFYRIPAHAA